MNKLKTRSKKIYVLKGEAFSSALAICDTLELAMKYWNWYLSEKIKWEINERLSCKTWVACSEKHGDEIAICERELIQGMEVVEE